MTVLNITYQGRSSDHRLDVDRDISDADIQRIAIEIVRSGGIGLDLPQLPTNTFQSFVVDRLQTPQGEARIYLRPKVPFGMGV